MHLSLRFCAGAMTALQLKLISSHKEFFTQVRLTNWLSETWARSTSQTTTYSAPPEFRWATWSTLLQVRWAASWQRVVQLHDIARSSSSRSLTWLWSDACSTAKWSAAQIYGTANVNVFFVLYLIEFIIINKLHITITCMSYSVYYAHPKQMTALFNYASHTMHMHFSDAYRSVLHCALGAYCVSQIVIQTTSGTHIY